MERVENQVLETIKKYSLIKRADHILIALSGGPDSVFLIEVLLKIKDEISFSLSCAHFNHSLRKEADDDLKFCYNFCLQKTLPFYSAKGDVSGFSKESGLSIEEAGRLLRLKFLREIKEKIKADKIALGHTFDDNIETVLLRLFKGTGIRGLTGILPSSFDDLIHPLIEVKKEDILGYLESHNIKYRVDISNLALDYERNIIRNKIVPQIKEDFPEFGKSLSRLSKIAKSYEKFFEKITSNLINALLTKESLNNLSRFPLKIYKEKLLLLDDFLIKEFFLRLLAKLSINSDFKLLERVTKFVFENKTGNTLNLKSDLVLICGYKYFYIEKLQEKMVKVGQGNGEEVVLEMNQPISFSGFLIKCRVFKRSDLEKERGKDFFKLDKKSSEAFFDFEKLTFPLKLRTFKDKDTIEPIGLNKEKKLQDVFVDEKIDRFLRKIFPLVLSNNKIIWIPEVLRSNIALITQSTQNIFYIVVEKLRDF